MRFIEKKFVDIKPSSTLSINELSKKIQTQGKKVFKFGLGQSPFPVPSILVKELQKQKFINLSKNLPSLIMCRPIT